MNTNTSLAFKSEIEALEAFAEGHFSFNSFEGMEHSDGYGNTTSTPCKNSCTDWGCDTSLHRRARQTTTTKSTVTNSPPPVGPFPPDCLQVVCLMKGNDKCLDCQASLDPEDYMYACIAYGTLLCMECANIHRSNPNLKDASQIKSIHADDWEFPQVLTMLEGGNTHFTKVCKSLETQEEDRHLWEASSPDNRLLLLYLNPAVHSYSKLLKHQVERVYQAHQRAVAEMDMPRELVAQCVMDAVLPVATTSPPDLSLTTSTATMPHSNNVGVVDKDAGATAQARILRKRASLDHIVPSSRTAYAYLSSSSSKTNQQAKNTPRILQNQDQQKPDLLPTSSSTEDATEESYLPFPSTPRRLSAPHHNTESTYDKYDYQQCSELLESWGQDKFDATASDFDLEDDVGRYQQQESTSQRPLPSSNGNTTTTTATSTSDDDDNLSDISDSSSRCTSSENMMLHLRELVWTIGKKVVPRTTAPTTLGRDPLVGRDLLITSTTAELHSTTSTTDHPNAHLLNRYPYNLKMPSPSSSSGNDQHHERCATNTTTPEKDERQHHTTKSSSSSSSLPPPNCEKNMDSVFAHSYGIRHVSLLQQEQLANISKRHRKSSQIIKSVNGQAA